MSRIKELLLLVACLFCIVFSSCNYFKIIASFNNGYDIEEVLRRNKTLIVHTGNEDWQLSYPSINREKEELVARYSSVGLNHQFYRFVKGQNSNRYPQKMGDPSNDVNLYISEYYIDSLNQIIIPISSIKRMDLYKKESLKSSLTYLGGIVGGYYGLMLMIALISGGF
jgi:hypothetical protein